MFQIGVLKSGKNSVGLRESNAFAIFYKTASAFSITEQVASSEIKLTGVRTMSKGRRNAQGQKSQICAASAVHCIQKPVLQFQVTESIVAACMYAYLYLCRTMYALIYA